MKINTHILSTVYEEINKKNKKYSTTGIIQLTLCSGNENITKNRNIHGVRNVWSAGQRHKTIYGFDAHAAFEGIHRTVGYGKQWSLVWSLVEERGWSRLKKGITF